MTKKELAAVVMQRLEEAYPDAVCSLKYEKPYELLFATRLSAQCTDARVNIVTKDLFKEYPTLESFATADQSEMEKIIRPCGLFKTKTKQVIECAQMLLEDYGGVVPDSIDELTKLPGIGRKTANLIVGDIYGKDSVVTDTHCIRICNRLGLVTSKEPFAVEKQLRKILDLSRSGDFCHRLVHFGRDVCTARSPKCSDCPLEDICKKKIKK